MGQFIYSDKTDIALFLSRAIRPVENNYYGDLLYAMVYTLLA